MRIIPCFHNVIHIDARLVFFYDAITSAVGIHFDGPGGLALTPFTRNKRTDTISIHIALRHQINLQCYVTKWIYNVKLSASRIFNSLMSRDTLARISYPYMYNKLGPISPPALCHVTSICTYMMMVQSTLNNLSNPELTRSKSLVRHNCSSIWSARWSVFKMTAVFYLSQSKHGFQLKRRLILTDFCWLIRIFRARDSSVGKQRDTVYSRHALYTTPVAKTYGLCVYSERYFCRGLRTSLVNNRQIHVGREVYEIQWLPLGISGALTNHRNPYSAPSCCRTHSHTCACSTL